MKRFYYFLLTAVLLSSVFTSCVEKETLEEVKTLPEYTLSVSLSVADSLYIGTDTSVEDDFGYYYIAPIKMPPFILNHSFAAWGFGMGLTYSSLTDVTTPGYTNNSAITGKGLSTNAYFTVNTGGDWCGIPAEITFVNGRAYRAKECYVTNATYAYLAIVDRNDGNPTPSVKEWTKDDTFILTITGYYDEETTGSIDFYLAKGLDVVNTWQKVDLTKLGMVDKVGFTLSSTDSGRAGMNTPSYFCLDHFTVIEH